MKTDRNLMILGTNFKHSSTYKGETNECFKFIEVSSCETTTINASYSSSQEQIEQ